MNNESENSNSNEYCTEIYKIQFFLLPITHYPLPITHYPLPITHYPLPITHYPIINHS